MEIEVPGMYVILSDQVSPPRLCAVHVPNSTYMNILPAIFVYRAGRSIVLLNAVLEVSIDA
jgi:hypothetical protein